jgi:putative sterol carrier protein
MGLRGPAATRARPISYAPLKRLIEDGEDNLPLSFERLADMLKLSGETADVQVDVVEGRRTRTWLLALRPKRATVSNDAMRRPDVHLIVARETWQRIAEGQLSPLEAFLSGRLRLRGDVSTATRLFKRAAGRGMTEIPLSPRR